MASVKMEYSGPQEWQPVSMKSAALIFLLTLLVSLLVSLGYTFLRDPVYRSSATLSIAPPEGVAVGNSLESARYVSEQVQVIRSHALLSAAHSQLTVDNPLLAEGLTLEQLLEMAHVEELPQGIVMMSVDGAFPDQIQAAAHSWLNQYLQQQTRDIQATGETTTVNLSSEDQQLRNLLEQKRSELARFADEHGISSTVREENEVINRTQGLNASLNDADRQLAAARARLEALKGGGGTDLVLKEGPVARQLSSMTSRLASLDQTLQALRSRYTEAYMQRDPSIAEKVKEQARLEEEIADFRKEAYQIALDQARANLLEAESLQQELQRQKNDLLSQAQTFKDNFERYQQRVRELERLEEMAHSTSNRLVEQTVAGSARAPQVRVLDEPRAPSEPISPNYTRDAAISVGVSLLLALLAAWGYVTYQRGRVWMFPGAVGTRAPQGEFTAVGVERRSPLPPSAAAPLPLEENRELRALPVADASSEELSESEMVAIYDAADTPTRAMLVALLSGVRPDELSALKCWDVQLVSNEISVPGRYQRSLPFDPKHAPVLEQQVSRRSGEQPLWSDGLGQPVDHEELENRLHCAVIDSGLALSLEVSLETVQMSYLVYQVARGVKVSELSAVAGRLQKSQLDVLARVAASGERGEDVGPFFPL